MNLLLSLTLLPSLMVGFWVIVYPVVLADSLKFEVNSRYWSAVSWTFVGCLVLHITGITWSVIYCIR